MDKTLGNRLKELRKNAKMNQKEFAQKIGINQSTLSAYENDNAMPSMEVLIATARNFGVSLDWLCGLPVEADNLSSLSGVERLLFQMDEVNELRFEIEVQEHLPNDEETAERRWNAAIRFYGNDKEHPCNGELCQFLSAFRGRREEVETFLIDRELYEDWKENALKRGKNICLTKREKEVLSYQERIRRRDALIEARLKKDGE